MERDTVRLLFALLRFCICGTPLSAEEKALYDPQTKEAVLALAKKHDLLHLACFGLKQNFPECKDDPLLRRQIMQAVLRCEQRNAELEKLCGALETARIAHMPLKGSVLRGYYPEGWMRSSCDIDVLVPEADADRAAQVLVESCGYVYQRKGGHDISLVTPVKIIIELHYELPEHTIAGRTHSVLDRIWEKATLREGCSFRYDLPDRLFYFHHIAHMAKHFEFGGCGIRPYLDLWLLNRLEGADWQGRRELLAQGGLERFAQTACSLSEGWLSGAETDLLTCRMEEYILRGGVFGNSENCILVQQQRQGGKLRYILSRVFAPYDELKFYYPILQKHRWLTPVMAVRRWLGWIFGDGAALRKLRYSNRVSREDSDNTKEFLDSLGL